MHDFIIITVLDTDMSKGRAGDDLKVSLDCDAQRVEPELVHHLGHAHSARHTPGLAVHPDR